MREFEIEQRVTDHAVKQGFIQLKLNLQGRRGWPDRLYLYRGRVLFIEFKVPGQKPTPLQLEIHSRIRASGCEVFVVDNPQIGTTLIDGWKYERDQDQNGERLS